MPKNEDIDPDELVECPRCGHSRMGVIQVQIDIIGTLNTRIRRRKCDDCSFLTYTAEVPLWVAKAHYEDE